MNELPLPALLPEARASKLFEGENMEYPAKPHDEEKVACASCMKDIPLSAAISSEAAGYTVYFCGTDCFSEWNRQAERSGLKQAGEHQSR
jgi:hypothetical protein